MRRVCVPFGVEDRYYNNRTCGEYVRDRDDYIINKHIRQIKRSLWRCPAIKCLDLIGYCMEKVVPGQDTLKERFATNFRNVFFGGSNGSDMDIMSALSVILGPTFESGERGVYRKTGEPGYVRLETDESFFLDRIFECLANNNFEEEESDDEGACGDNDDIDVKICLAFLEGVFKDPVNPQGCVDPWCLHSHPTVPSRLSHSEAEELKREVEKHNRTHAFILKSIDSRREPSTAPASATDPDLAPAPGGGARHFALQMCLAYINRHHGEDFDRHGDREHLDMNIAA